LKENEHMNELLQQIAACVEAGKIDKASPYPPAMNGQEGADEITQKALEAGFTVDEILEHGLMAGMEKVGIAFRDNLIFVPQVLMSARAMSAAMNHLKPHFASGASERKGTFIIGTVEGDLHDIGKNLVAMMAEGNGYEVVDLGVDVKAEVFIENAQQHPNSVIGLSCLLTTTMPNMEKIVKAIKDHDPAQVICIGGAPVHDDFAARIGADSYAEDPQGTVEFLDRNLEAKRAA
jgi:methanogenic corrinoid protein MtbC1